MPPLSCCCGAYLAFLHGASIAAARLTSCCLRSAGTIATRVACTRARAAALCALLSATQATTWCTLADPGSSATVGLVCQGECCGRARATSWSLFHAFAVQTKHFVGTKSERRARMSLWDVMPHALTVACTRLCPTGQRVSCRHPLSQGRRSW